MSIAWRRGGVDVGLSYSSSCSDEEEGEEEEVVAL